MTLGFLKTQYPRDRSPANPRLTELLGPLLQRLRKMYGTMSGMESSQSLASTLCYSEASLISFYDNVSANDRRSVEYWRSLDRYQYTLVFNDSTFIETRHEGNHGAGFKRSHVNTIYESIG